MAPGNFARYSVLCICLFIILQLPLHLLVNSYGVFRIFTGKKMKAASIGEEEVSVPREQLEEVRRQTARGLQSLWVFLRYRLEEMTNMSKSQEEAREVDALLAEAEDRLRVTQFDFSKLDHLTGLTAWREKEAASVSRLVQRRIHALQHPVNCSTARKLLCPLHKYYFGMGATVHLVVQCLLAGYESGRTVLLHHKRKDRIATLWEDFFYSIHHPCVRLTTNLSTPWPGTHENEVVDFSPEKRQRHGYTLKPLAIPQDIASRVQRFSDMPGAWWVSQFVIYVMRLQPTVLAKIDEIVEDLNYSHPIVAVHVRRTDKRKEASYRPLEKYMKHVEDYYLGLDLATPSSPPTRRRVFLASDEPSIITEAKEKYPTYEFLCHRNGAKRVKDRFTSHALKNIVAELYLLAHADYLVCTFSSNVCRVAFEWMMTIRSDASARVASVDTVYYYDDMRLQYNNVRFSHRLDLRRQGNDLVDKTLKQDGSVFFLRTIRQNGSLHVKAGEDVISFVEGMGKNGQTNIIVPGRDNRDTKLLPDYKLQEIIDVVNVPFPVPLRDDD